MSKATRALETPPVPLQKRYLDPVGVNQYDQRYRGGWRAVKGAHWRRTLLRALAFIQDRGSCLDIPCGTGYLTEVLEGKFETLIAGDISPAMVAKARSRVATPGLVADALRLPFADDSLDCVMNIRFMVHFGREQRQAFLTSLARVSRRYVLVNYNHRYTFKNWRRRLWLALWVTSPRKDPDKKCSRDEVLDQAEAASLRVVKIFQPWWGRLFLSERWLILFEKIPRPGGR